jgi:hypothetical protein
VDRLPTSLRILPDAFTATPDIPLPLMGVFAVRADTACWTCAKTGTQFALPITDLEGMVHTPSAPPGKSIGFQKKLTIPSSAVY